MNRLVLALTILTPEIGDKLIKAGAKKTDEIVAFIKKYTDRMCFTGATIVRVHRGYKKIEDIRVGDQVYVEDPETGEQGYKVVKELFISKVDTLWHISVKDIEISTTYSHPFYVVGKGWLEARDLEVGDLLKLADGELTEVKAIGVETLARPVKVYNFEVADWHTYYVSEYDVWVHNRGTNTCPEMMEVVSEGIVKTVDDIPLITPKSLPTDEEQAVLNTLKHIDDGTIPSGKLSKKWGTPFGNREGYLPDGNYLEYRVAPPIGMKNAGARRIVKNIDTGQLFYTWTHYGDSGDPAFLRIR